MFSRGQKTERRSTPSKSPKSMPTGHGKNNASFVRTLLKTKEKRPPLGNWTMTPPSRQQLFPPQARLIPPPVARNSSDVKHTSARRSGGIFQLLKVPGKNENGSSSDRFPLQIFLGKWKSWCATLPRAQPTVVHQFDMSSSGCKFLPNAPPWDTQVPKSSAGKPKRTRPKFGEIPRIPGCTLPILENLLCIVINGHGSKPRLAPSEHPIQSPRK